MSTFYVSTHTFKAPLAENKEAFLATADAKVKVRAVSSCPRPGVIYARTVRSIVN